MRIAFIVKGDEKKGMGHVFRCIAIADRIVSIESEADIHFFLHDAYPESILSPKHYQSTLLKTRNAQELIDNITQAPDIIIFDIQNVSKDEVIPLKEKYPQSKIVCFDNLDSGRQYVDICIDANISNAENRQLGYSEKVKYLLGPEYIVFRNEIHEYKAKEITLKPTRVVISVGYIDVNKRMREIFKALKGLNFKVDAIVGDIDDDYKKELMNIARDNFNGHFTFHIDPDNFYRIISEADIAFCSGGITLYELAYYGIPTIIYCQVQHQMKIAEQFHDKCSVISLGDGATASEIKNVFMRLCIDHNLRKIMNDNLSTMVDGRGLDRLIKQLMK